MADVFISYSRRDKEFVQVLHKALAQSQYDAWVDWEDIPLTADWWAEIQSGIDAADTFIFVISPASIASKVCGQEIDYAAENHKRILPVLRHDDFDRSRMRSAISRHNWLFFRPQDDFDTAFQALVQALNTDLDYVRWHTRLLVRSQEWRQQQRRADYLLRGRDLEEAEGWLAMGSQQVVSPTPLQQEYVGASRQAERQRQQRERRRLQVFGIVVTGLALVATAFAIWAWRQRQVAIAERENARQQEAVAKEQSIIAFAHQLATEAREASNINPLSLRDDRLTRGESQIAFGLAALPQALADTLRADQPRLITFSPDDRYVAIITQDYRLKAWDLNSGETVLDWQDAARVVEVGFDPASSLLTVATADGILRLWRIASPQFTQIAILDDHDGALTDTAFSPDGRYLATGSQDFTLRLWDLERILSQRRRAVVVIRNGGPVLAVNFSPDGRHIVSASQDNAVRVWTMEGRNILCIIHNQPLRLARFNAEGDKLGSISGDMLVRVWPWPQLIEAPQTFPEVRPACLPS